MKNAVGADCYDYSMAKLDEMEKKSNSTSDAELCENKFVIDMTSVRFKNALKRFKQFAATGVKFTSSTRDGNRAASDNTIISAVCLSFYNYQSQSQP